MRQVRAYLQLVRLPAVFTAMADIFLGFLLTHLTLAPVSQFLGLLGGSSALYLAGMALNDVFDRRIDAKERPQRPIPSRRVPLPAAAALGAILMAAGFGCAYSVGPASATIAVALAALILAYDGFLKTTPIGPIAMGGCRLLNVMLGASATFFVWARPQILAAAAMGIYVAGVTWFARQEAGRSVRSHLIAAASVIHAGWGALIAFVFVWPGEGNRWIALAALAGVAAFVDVRIASAVRDPRSEKVQATVKRMLLAIILLDATIVYFKTGDIALALATGALIIPAATLGRWIFIT